ncbi:cell division control protein [Nowakowskiella sp. JEL0078]|nr:cell division control protein [Nowakowskiella sp. JEL0078]
MREGPAKGFEAKKTVRKLSLINTNPLNYGDRYEGQRDALSAQAWNMEQANFATENLKNTLTTVDAMKMASKELKTQYKKINIDKIENMQDEMEDLLEQAGEIQDAIGRTYGLPEDVDEADLEAELDALGDELLMEDESEPSYLSDALETPAVPNQRVETSAPGQLETPLRTIETMAQTDKKVLFLAYVNQFRKGCISCVSFLFLFARPSVTLTGYVGFDSIPKQIEKKLLKKPFTFNIMLVGRTGLGKSTLVNTIFSAHLIDSKSTKKPQDSPRQTTEIVNVTHVIEEGGVKLKLTITDTPGYGDQVNNENCWEPIVKYIKEQYSSYLRKELTPTRERRIPDTRVHAVLFFIAPTGHALAPLDIIVMKKISENCNVIPVIAKSDSLTIEERTAFKRRIKEEIEFHGIKAYPYIDIEDDVILSETDRIDKQIVQQIRDMIPFAVVGSERNVVIDGKAVRGRRTRFGIINVENETHCEFVHLRNFLTRTHLQDLIEVTSQVHYESFRTRQLLALKESTTAMASRNTASEATSN